MSLYGVTTDDPDALRAAYAEIELVGPRQALRNRLARMREADEQRERERREAARQLTAERYVELVTQSFSTGRPYSNRRREIIQQVLDAHPGLTVDDLRSASRLAKHVRPRQLVMRRLHAELGLSLSEIGAMFNKDHTTVMYAVQRGGK